MNQNTYEFRWIFLIFRRWLWLIIAFAILAGIAAFFITAHIPPVYKASVMVYIEPSKDTQTNEYNALIAASRLALTYSEMIKSQTLLNATIKDLGLKTTVGQLSKKITVEPIQNTQLIRLTVQDESSEQSVKIANYLAKSFVDYINTTQSERFVADLAELQSKLQDIDSRIINNQSKINDLQVQVMTYTNKLDQLQSTLVETQGDIRVLEQDYYDIQLAMAQAKDNIKIIQAAKAPDNRFALPYKAIVILLANQEVATGSSGYTSAPASERQVTTYAQLLQSQDVLQEVIKQLQLTQPIDVIQRKITVQKVENTQLIQISVEDYDAQLAVKLANSLGEVFVLRMQASLIEPYSSRVEAAKSRLAQMGAEEDSLKAQIEQVSSAKVQAESEISRLENIVNEDRAGHQNSEDEYDRLRQQANDASRSVYVSETASTPSKSSTDTRLYIGLAGILGGMIGFLFAFLLEYLDDTIRSVNDISKEFGLNILGMISSLNIDESRLVVVADPLSPVSESFSILANNVSFATMNQQSKTLIITSPSSKDGKSLILGNLAVTMARLEHRVVAVDADLRLPTLHKLFGLDQSGGLTDALMGGRLDGWLKEVNMEGLRILPCGKLPINPTGVIGSARMRSLLQELHQQANLVLIDCPPVLPVADASVLASMADGVMLVVRINQTRRRETRETLRRLQQAGAKVIGVILNAVPASSEGYYTYRYRKQEKITFSLGRLLAKDQKSMFSLGKLLPGKQNGK